MALICLGSPLFAQKGPLKGKKVVRIPLPYAEPDGSVVPVKSTRSNGTGSIWKVYSDRSANKTYKDETMKEEHKTLGFMESFYVADENESSVRIAKYASDATVGETISKMEFTNAAQDYGWISKSRVLLWSDALVDTSSRFTQKALTVKRQSALKNLATAKARALSLFNSPSLSADSRNRNEVRIFDFLYIYKKEGTSLLIGKSPEILPSNASENIMGWVNTDNIHTWGQVLCLEPNSEKDAVAERKGSKIKPAILATTQEALLFKKGNFSGTPAKSEDPGEKGYDSYKFRYPVLHVSDAQNEIIRTGYVTDLFDNNTGKSVMSDGEQVENNRKYNKIRSDWQNINLVFVIDGSEQCKEYLRPVFDAITEISYSLADRNRNSRIRYGAVVYREYSCEPEVQVTQQALTNVAVLKSFLAKDSSMNIHCSEQTGAPVYFALDKAMRMFDDTNQTNVLILVGAEGNYAVDSKGISEEKIKNNLAKWQCSLMAFQVVKKADPIYEKFVDQIRDIAAEAAKRTSNSYARYQIGKAKTDKSKITFAVERPQILKLPFPEKSPVPGTIVYAKMNEKMRIGYFRDNITDLVEELVRDHEKVLADFAAMIKGQGAKEVRVSEAVFLLVKNGEIDPYIFSLLDAKEVNQLFVEGQIPVKNDKLKNPLYTYTLFLTEDELQNLIDIFRKLSVAEATSDLRKGLVDAYKQLVVTYYGKESKKAMNRPLSEIQKRVTGLPSRNKLFIRYTLEDLNEEKKVSRADLQEIRNTLVDINKNLNSIRQKDKYSFVNNDSKFYWLPAKFLD